jgi:hypothetical protein
MNVVPMRRHRQRAKSECSTYTLTYHETLVPLFDLSLGEAGLAQQHVEIFLAKFRLAVSHLLLPAQIETSNSMLILFHKPVESQYSTSRET